LNEDKSPADSNVKENIDSRSHEDFVTPSVLLFLDQLLVSAGGWIYWLIISKITTASEIGLAITVYSLVILVTTLALLGIEYPLLKKSVIPGSRILGTSLSIELALALGSIPIVIIAINTLYDESIRQFTWLSITLLVLITIENVLRFALLGISNSRIVLIIDLVAQGIKLPAGFLLVYFSFGAFGILLAYLVESIFIACASFYFVRKSFSFQLGDSKYFKETIKDALINTPAKLSKMVIVTLSIVLLSFMNVTNSDIGIFYIALMITIVAASFASSMAYMVIPTSSKLMKDLTPSSLRISLSLTAPIVVALLVAPRSILSLIGPEYENAELLLFVLSLSIIPASITINLVSMLNISGKSKMLVLNGLVQIVAFFVSFFILVPTYGTLGMAVSIFIAYLSSSLLLLILTDHKSFRYLVIACLSVLAGFIVGSVTSLIIGDEQQLLAITFSIVTSIVIIFLLKNMSISETKSLLKPLIQRR
jgi:O-antigen/teichoic acid export membrane protein